MDNMVEPEKLQILKHSIQILQTNPKITPTLIFRLSFAILTHSILTHSFYSYTLTRLQYPTLPPDQLAFQWVKLIIFQFIYLLFFSTVVSNFSGKPVPVSADPPVSLRLSQISAWLLLLMVMYYLASLILIGFVCIAIDPETDTVSILYLVPLVLAFGILILVYVYIIALWNLASVVSVLETGVNGFSALNKSYELLKGKVLVAGVLVAGYLLICGAVNGVFEVVVVHGESRSIVARVVVGGFLIGVLLVVNLVSLLIQSVFYYVCKSYHHEEIDKTALNDLLRGYLGGEYVPLKTSVQMESVDV